MYQNIYHCRHKNLIHLWDDTTGYRFFPYQQYAYIDSPNGEYTALYGNKVTKVTDVDAHEPESLYESDLNPAMRTLIDLYTDSSDVSTNHRILNFDIEVAKGVDGYSSVEDAVDHIMSIAYKFNGEYTVLILSNDEFNKTIPGVTVKSFTSEKELITEFYKRWAIMAPTVITGWNINGYR